MGIVKSVFWVSSILLIILSLLSFPHLLAEFKYGGELAETFGAVIDQAQSVLWY